MKLFAFTMAFLILVLPALPCKDNVSTAGKAKIENVEQGSHEEEQEHNDACSPFCYCTCCAGFSIHHFFAAPSSLLLVDSKLYTSYLPGNLIEYSTPIWQPPQLQV